MVVIGVDRHAWMELPRDDGEEVGPFFDLRAELAQLGRHGGQAVGFLDAPACNVAQGAAALGEQREHGGGHRRVRDVVQIHVDCLELLARIAHLDGVFLDRNASAHALQHFGEAHVALDAVAPHALDAHRAAADCARGEKVRCGRRVAFDEDFPGRPIAPRRHVEVSPPGAPHLEAEAAHHVQGDLDIGLGDELALHFDARVGAGER